MPSVPQYAKKLKYNQWIINLSS